ncbi:MAG: hypothetical protein ACC700_20510, partial [Anaerolineales bacterium]
MRKLKSKTVRWAGLSAVAISLLLLAGSVLAAPPAANGTLTVAESPDFATLELRDPWDMSEFADVSQYLNRSGQASYLQNIQVQSGIFSATSTGTKDAQFFPLFPGYETAMLIGKVGELFPIDPSGYRCLFIAMRVESGPAEIPGGPDQFQVLWFADERLQSGPWGQSVGIQLYPEAGGGQPTHSWRLYQADMVGDFLAGDGWNSQPAWRGLRIDPTIQAGIDFQVDWVRLTDCSANSETVTWSPPAGSFYVWLQPEGESRPIRITDSAISSPGSIDTQGLAPGTYTVQLGGQTGCCAGPAPSPSTLVVNQTPIANFMRPSPSSGEDYATQAGNSWDFGDGTDVTLFVNVNAGFADGLVNLQTNSALLPGGADPQLHLNSPKQIAAGSAYRYLNFRLSTSGSLQNVP